MNIETLKINNINITVVTGAEKIITDTQSALDLIATASYEGKSNRIALDKASIDDRFFILSSGLAGEILQKFVTYDCKLAIFGDYSKYTSKPLKDFIYESNKGGDIFFSATKDEAINRLAWIK